MQLENTAAIVTGGGSGIGAASARMLAARGALVVIFDLDLEAARQTAAEVGGLHVRGDVAATADLRTAADLAHARRPLRVLVNAAGIARTGRIVGRTLAVEDAYPLEQFEQVIGTNLTGTFNAIRVVASVMAAEPPLEDNQRGVIVNLASLAGIEGQVGQSAYAASKGGVIALTLPVARDLARYGIRVNTIAPGAVDTPLIGTSDYREHLSQQSLFPARLARPDEVAHLVLASIENDYVNAAVIRIDGGARLPPR